MKVILVSIDWRRPQDGKTGLGIASLAAALEAAGMPWKIIDAQVNSPEFSLEQVLRELRLAIAEAGAQCLVGFGAFVWNDSEVSKLIHQIKGSGARIVLGGPQISYMAKGELEAAYPEADYFVRGQGEMAIVALAQGLLPSDFGIHVAGTSDVGNKADHDLLELPSPYLLGIAKIQDSIRWETQRGCPFKCSFCQHREPGSRLKHRWFNSQRLTQELEMFAAAGVKRISVLDPIFHTNPARAIDVLNSVKAAGVTAQLSLQCRFETCTDDFLNALEGLNVTLEFGLQTMVKAEYLAIQRPNNMDVVLRKVREVNERQIDFEVSLIYGLPNQTLDSFRANVDWCLQQNIPRVRAWPLMLLRGTPLYEQKHHFGFRESDDLRIPIVIASNSFSEAEYSQMERIAEMLEEQ